MKVETDRPLAGLTTMRVGGPARRVVTAETAEEIVQAVQEVDEAGEQLLLLSGGSNLVIADEPLDATVVRVANRGVHVDEESLCGGVLVRVAAGEPWDEFVALTVERGWSGVEALSGIPGLVGATPVQNVGAYGQEVSQTIARVRTWDRQTGTQRTFMNADCQFGYRNSLFKTSSFPGPASTNAAGGSSPRFVVLDVTFHLVIGDYSAPVAYAALAQALGVEMGAKVPLADAREAVLQQRRTRGMVLEPADHDTWSCGSFFTNPFMSLTDFDALLEKVAAHCGPDVVPPRFPSGADESGVEQVKTSAAWLIDRAGFGKGFGAPGPATLSTKHTLAVTNRGSATAADVLHLARRVRDGVEQVFGVRLVNEPVLVGAVL